MSTTDTTYRCSECGHETTEEQMERKATFEPCHECGAKGNHKGYYSVWYCPNCETGYAGTRPTAGNGGVRGCNQCFTSVPENHLREAIETGDVEQLEKFLPSDERSMFIDTNKETNQ